ncbi:MAG: shikimate dehydrogenase [Qingshengfaniella sp.]
MTKVGIPLAGVIGDPVSHSRSPRLHAHWLGRCGLNGHYVPLPVAARDLEMVLQALPRAGFVGVNITVPHKEAVLDLADNVTSVARRIGAANTLTFRPDGRIHADNTDAFGFSQSLRQAVPDWKPKAGPVTVFGAGGAARAVLVALIDKGVPDIRLLNRTRERAEALARHIGGPITVHDWDDAPAMVADSDMVVNTTSLGMVGQPPFPDILTTLRPGTIATDIVYTPLETPFLLAAARQGARTVDGLGMLLHQAVPGFERWFGALPEVDAATRAAALG